MRAHRIGRTKRARRLRTRAPWLCALAALIAIAAASRVGGHESFAQSTSAPADGTPVPIRPYPEQVNPAAANVSLQNQPAESSSGEVNAPGAANARTPVPGQLAKQETAASPALPRQKQIADDTANLLKLANSLKAEVDKTTEDTLSVAVIRHAEEIEKLAHKMRTK